MVASGTDPCTLSADMVPMHVTAAMDTVMEAAFYRHSVPVTFWKLMRWMNIGRERKLSGAEVVLRRFATDKINTRMASRSGTSSDILSHYINDPEYLDQDGEPGDLLRNTLINKMVALRDPIASALPWLIYNIATNPHALVGMRKELAPIAARKSNGGGTVIFGPEETGHLLYQRAALFESLRLYPPGLIEHKTALVDDVLPSGHKVHQGDNIFISVYSMGRMESLWGQDCRDFRPDRWITEDGSKLRHVPSYKFMPFNTGPRACIGKNIAVAQITAIAATIVWNFDVEVLEKCRVKPKLSVVLQMKNGLMVKVKKRASANASR
uniref:Uncharacterized protein n=1 Tax=Avena sativa TaxID=4498 RepID=A0ACD5TAX7_AVESA